MTFKLLSMNWMNFCFFAVMTLLFMEENLYWSRCQADAQLLVGHHHAAELCSQPRVAPVIQTLGLQSVLSCNLLTGWDFEETHCAQLSVDLLDRLMIDSLILSPPCTVFSELQRLWNFKRTHPAKVQAMWRQGMLHLVHSSRCARRQLASNSFLS